MVVLFFLILLKRNQKTFSCCSSKKVVRERIQPFVGLKFVFVPQGGNVRVSFNPHGGAYSLVGTDCLKSKEQSTMNLGWLDAGTIMHEFGHVLGMIHEHQNPRENLFHG